MNTQNFNYWWVNHNQTFKYEIDDGYIWSPKKNKNDNFNQTYKNLTNIRPGDVIFSYANKQISAFGIAKGTAYDHPKPEEFFKKNTEFWSSCEGWRVDIDWTMLDAPVYPQNYKSEIGALLPGKYSPLLKNGKGNQNCYVAKISSELGHFLISIIKYPKASIKEKQLQRYYNALEDTIVQEIKKSPKGYTEKERLIKARDGQGFFRKCVIKNEKLCRVTGVTDERFLIASHIKPWRDSSDTERLDGENGLLLSPHIDALFDKGKITFSDEGYMMVSLSVKQILSSWNINTEMHVGNFSKSQQKYLAYHREKVFKS